MTGSENPLERWNRRFSQPNYLFGKEPNAYLREQVRHLRPGSALAVCDGEGRNGVWLAEQGLQVDAFDFSPVGIEKAKRLQAARGVHVNWSCCAWQDFDWRAEVYDNVVGIFFQFATPAERSDLFARMDRSLKPGGTLIIQGYSQAQMQFKTGGPGVLEHLYSEALMREAFAAYEVLDLRTYEQELHEGDGHIGPSGPLGLVARKR